MNVNAVSDSDVFIDWLQGRPEADVAFSRYQKVFLSRISWIEVLAGAKTVEREAAALDAMADFPLLELTEEISRATILLRRAGRLKLPDAAILATAQVFGLVLLTRNERDFGAIHPAVVYPYRL